MEALVPVAMIAVVGVLPVVGIIALVVHHHRAVKQRAHAMAAYAAHREWTYRSSDPSLVHRFAGEPFGRGRNRQATNVFLGHHDGRAFTAFDYRHTTSSGNSSSTHHHSVLALHLGVTAPPLEVGPFGPLRKLWDKVVNSDVAVGDPTFDQAFLVKTTSPDFARDVLHPHLRQILWHHQHLTWRFEGDSMLVFRPGQHGVHEIEAKLHFMDAVLDAIPPYVWDRLRGELRRPGLGRTQPP